MSTSTFSPDGRVFQVEYAMKAVEQSGTVMGVKCIDGVVVGVENIIQHKMLVPGSSRRVYAVDEHAGMALSGLAADARKLANEAASECESYRSFYGHVIPGHVLNKRLSSSVHTSTLYWYLRPYGASMLLGTYDSNGPELYQIEPTGLGNRYYAAALGKHKAGAITELEKIDFDTITARKAAHEIGRIMYKLHDDVKDKEFELELGWVCDESGKKFQRVPEKLREEVVAAAKAEKEREDMDDSSDDDA